MSSSGSSHSGVWIWLVVTFVYFAGLASGAAAWAAIFRTAQARWTPVINRLGHSMLWFLLLMFGLLVLLLAGLREYAPWTAHAVAGKEAWLNARFMIVREVLVLGLMLLAFFLMARWSLSADAKRARGEEITRPDHYRLNAVAIAGVYLYCIAMSLVSWDFVMSLSPEWVSTMFAPYYFCTNLYVGMAALILMAGWLRDRPEAQPHLRPQQFHDMGNLLLGFSLFNMGLFFAQYLTIWYGNIHVETQFLIVRYLRGSWPYLGWTAFTLGYAIPFMLLQSRTLKRNPRMLMPVAALAVVGVAVERYVLIAPSLQPHASTTAVGPGLIWLASGTLFVGLAIGFLRRYPLVSSADEALGELETPERMERGL